MREPLEAERANLSRSGQADSNTQKLKLQEKCLDQSLSKKSACRPVHRVPLYKPHHLGLYYASLPERPCVGGSADSFGQDCAQAVKQCIVTKRYNPIKRAGSARGVPY